MIRGGGWGSGPMILKPRAKGAQGSEDHLCKRNCPMAEPIEEVGLTLMLGEKRRRGRGRKLRPAFSSYRRRRERGGVVPIPHVSDGRPTAHRSGRTTARRQVACSMPLTGGPRSDF
jgi:hypothetical protein